MMASGATLSSSASAVRFLLEQGAEVNIKSKSGDSALGWAALSGDAVAVRLLLDASADANVADDEGHTPLMWVSREGKVEIIQMLLKAGADTERTDNEGKMAVDLAEELENPEERIAVLSLLQKSDSRKEEPD